MDSSYPARKSYPLGELLLDPDVQRRIVAFDYRAHWRRNEYFKTDGFAALVKAISLDSVTLERALLRRWRVR